MIAAKGITEVLLNDFSETCRTLDKQGSYAYAVGTYENIIAEMIGKLSSDDQKFIVMSLVAAKNRALVISKEQTSLT